MDARPPVTAYLGLGTNVGDRLANIKAALEHLRMSPGIDLARLSSLYLTSPVGMVDQPDFYNMATQIETTLTPQSLLETSLGIERKMGRERTIRWGPRVIDIDILLYGEERIRESQLTIPHPLLKERAFVVIPLLEIVPDLRLPGETERIDTILQGADQFGNVLRIGAVC